MARRAGQRLGDQIEEPLSLVVARTDMSVERDFRPPTLAPQQVTGLVGRDREQPRLEPRQRWPRGSPCASPQVEIKGEPGDPVILEIDCFHGRRHLPVIRARQAA